MHSARRTIVAAAVAAGGMILGMGEAQAAPKSGVWGGQLAVLTLNEQGGHLEFGCGYATLAAPVTPDRKGRFKAVGLYFPDPVGLVDADLPPVKVTARIEGAFTGNSVRIRFKPAGGAVEILDLAAGKRGKLIRCL